MLYNQKMMRHQHENIERNMMTWNKKGNIGQYIKQLSQSRDMKVVQKVLSLTRILDLLYAFMWASPVQKLREIWISLSSFIRSGIFLPQQKCPAMFFFLSEA